MFYQVFQNKFHQLCFNLITFLLLYLILTKMGNDINPQTFQNTHADFSNFQLDIESCNLKFVNINTNKDEVRLAYYAYQHTQTISNLQQLYKNKTGQELVLKNENLNILPQIPLVQILATSTHRKVFDQVLSRLQTKRPTKLDHFKDQKSKECFKNIQSICQKYEKMRSKIQIPEPQYQSQYMEQNLKQQQSEEKKSYDIQSQMESNYNYQEYEEHSNYQNNQNQEQAQINKGRNDKKTKQREKKKKTTYKQYPDCYMNGNTNIFLNKQKDFITLQTIALDNHKNDILGCSGSYFQGNFQLTQKNYINGSPIMKNIEVCYKVTLIKVSQQQSEGKTVVLQCLGDTKVKYCSKKISSDNKNILEQLSHLDKYQKKEQKLQKQQKLYYDFWMRVSSLKVNYTICGVNQDFKSFALYKVVKIQKMEYEKKQRFYKIEVLPSHHMIANYILIHNANKYTLQVAYLQSSQKVSFYLTQQLRQVFPDCQCYLGNQKLDSQKTFGDYKLHKISDKQMRIIKIASQQLKQTKSSIMSFIELNDKPQSTIGLKPDQKSKRLRDSFFAIKSDRSISRIQQVKQEENNSVVVVNRCYIESMYYHLIKQPIYRAKEKQEYEQYKRKYTVCQNVKGVDIPLQSELGIKFKEYCQVLKIQKEIKQSIYKNLNQQDLFAILLYTSNQIFSKLNQYLRCYYNEGQYDEMQQSRHLPLMGFIKKSIQKIDVFHKQIKLYRGIQNCKIRQLIKQTQRYKQQFIVFKSFTSTSTEKSVAEKFQGKTGIIFTIYSTLGRSISKFSYFQYEKEFVILPFTYFAFKIIYQSEENNQQRVDEIQLYQIPLPITNRQKIIFWVDDRPENNFKIIDYLMKKYKDIQVVQVTRTFIMTLIIRKFFHIYKLLNRKLMIISDMVRQEDDKLNYYAGADLIKITQQMGISDKIIIYGGNRQQDLNNIKQKMIHFDQRFVTNQQNRLEQLIKEQFKI